MRIDSVNSNQSLPRSEGMRSESSQRSNANENVQNASQRHLQAPVLHPQVPKESSSNPLRRGLILRLRVPKEKEAEKESSSNPSLGALQKVVVAELQNIPRSQQSETGGVQSLKRRGETPPGAPPVKRARIEPERSVVNPRSQPASERKLASHSLPGCDPRTFKPFSPTVEKLHRENVRNADLGLPTQGNVEASRQIVKQYNAYDDYIKKGGSSSNSDPAPTVTPVKKDTAFDPAPTADSARHDRQRELKRLSQRRYREGVKNEKIANAIVAARQASELGGEEWASSTKEWAEDQKKKMAGFSSERQRAIWERVEEIDNRNPKYEEEAFHLLNHDRIDPASE